MGRWTKVRCCNISLSLSFFFNLQHICTLYIRNPGTCHTAVTGTHLTWDTMRLTFHLKYTEPRSWGGGGWKKIK
jgi:hypothetical protein